MVKKALLLVGSPKEGFSTSDSLGNYLLSKLNEKGYTNEKAYIHRLIFREEKQEKLINNILNSDLIILAFPLYVDSLPAPLIKMMEFLSEKEVIINNERTIGFCAIVNSGFPEKIHNMTALKICEIFCKDMGFEWKGGLAIGGGAVIHGRPLEDCKGMVKNIISGLNIVAEYLANSKVIPQEAVDLIEKPMMPKGLYRRMGNLGWRIQAMKNGTNKKLKRKPYNN